MDITKKIKMAEAYANISEAELARRLEKTSQAFGQRLKTGKFKSEELEEIAAALGCEVVIEFRFPDGTTI